VRAKNLLLIICAAGLSLLLAACNKPVNSASSSTDTAEDRTTIAPDGAEHRGADRTPDRDTDSGTIGDDDTSNSPAAEGSDSTTTGFERAAKLPEMEFSEAHEQSNLLKSGGTMPDFELADLNGEPQKLSGHFGERLTVVFFWTGGGARDQGRAKQQMVDLQIDFADRFAEHGVAIIGINQKQSPQDVKPLVELAEATFVTLLDESGGAFSQIATEFLPRTYLLAADGKVLWFDIGYSRDTLRRLNQAIRYALDKSSQSGRVTP